MPPGWSGAPTWGVPAPRPATVGQATAAFVLGLVGLVACLAFVPSVLAVVFGVLALSKVSASAGTRGGKGLATTGIVLGVLGVLAGIGFWVLWSNDDFQEGFQEATTFGFEGIDVDDCVSLPDQDSGTVLGLAEVPCTGPHEGEVYAKAALGGSSFPGEAASQSQTEEICTAEFEGYVGLSYDESYYDVYYLYPQQSSWDRGDQDYICILIDPSGENLPAGSLRGVGE